VRADMSTALDRIVPEDKKGQGLYRHDAEGSDDMPVRIVLEVEERSVERRDGDGR
jgi:thiamine phosphate synthase YjbQ (UPF0047 family)